MYSKILSLGLQKYYQPHLFFPSEGRLRDLVISHLKGTNVLDAGCGNGWLSVCAWEKGFNVYSLDVGESEIGEISFLLRSGNADVELARASLLTLPYVDSFFDSIMCVNVLEHVSEVEKAVLEMKRVLKGGGRLIIVVPNGLTFGLFYDKVVYRLVPTRSILSHVYKTTFSLAKHDISMLNLNKKEPIGHCQQFTLASIRKLLIEHGFKIVKIVNWRFLSPYVRSFSTLLRMGPATAFERIDTRTAEYIPPNLASEWAIICEKTLE